jgi:hypothetical protein
MSRLFESILQGNFAWTAPVVTFFVLLDIVLVYFIRKKNLSVNNKYFELHGRFGFKKLNSIKVIFALLNIWQALRPVRYNPVGFFLSVLIYSCIVTKLFYDSVKVAKSTKK